MAKHATYLNTEDARAQAEFYVSALGGEILHVMTFGDAPDSNEEIKDKVMHLSLMAAGVNFMMSDSFEPVNYGTTISQCMEFKTPEEARTAFDNLAAGGTVVQPLEMQFWGAMFGQLVDKFGVQWSIVTEHAANPS
ncbi:VOC family protein [Tumebacillus permanentifrigoris]|uniref:PhnB protein n=1 Tax=Tumebacillus permanentifrigoris TaxID=378543 RepID=A0A316D6K4_9BACL|nr:VOC family protein [Tumebacillus permanentifrigoris]PWK09607.1 PhnB protein [Tumebacillus permanentifrigoris]